MSEPKFGDVYRLKSTVEFVVMVVVQDEIYGDAPLCLVVSGDNADLRMAHWEVGSSPSWECVDAD